MPWDHSYCVACTIFVVLCTPLVYISKSVKMNITMVKTGIVRYLLHFTNCGYLKNSISGRNVLHLYKNLKRTHAAVLQKIHILFGITSLQWSHDHNMTLTLRSRPDTTATDISQTWNE